MRTNNLMQKHIDAKRNKFANLYFGKNYFELSSSEQSYIDNELHDFYNN